MLLHMHPIGGLGDKVGFVFLVQSQNTDEALKYSTCMKSSMSRNKSSPSSQERNQPCTNDNIDDIVGATSGSRDEIEVFATYVNGFHRSLKFTWIISDVQLPFLDLCLKPVSDRLLTSIHYKDTDTHSYLNYTSSHPARCKNSIPYSQFLRLRRICSGDNDFENKSIEMASFFPKQRLSFQCDSAIPHHALISERSDVPDAQPTIPLVLTYHPTTALIKNIITRNFHLLRDDPDTRDIYEPV